MLSQDVRFLAIVLMTFTLEFKVSFPVMAANEHELTGSKTGTEEVFVLSHTDKEKITHIATIIDSLEKLGILEASKQFCYSLEKIVKNKMLDTHTNTWMIDLKLHVKEMGRKRLKGNTNAAVTSHPDMTSSGAGDDADGGDFSDKCIWYVEKGSKQAGNLDKSGLEQNIITDNASELYESDVRRGNTSGNVSSVAMVGDDGGIDQDKTQGADKNQSKDDGGTGGKLSKTQVMVISTCSTVVGLFFIVAVILRVNNYIKRVREEQAAARRPSYRSTSFGLRANSQSQQNDQNNAKDSRLDAALNKENTDTADMVGGRKEDEEEGDLTPKLSNQETRPLLIVTAASAPSSPCLQRTRTDYQYSNKDDDETMTADEKHGQKKQTARNADISNRRRPKQRRNNNGYTRVDGPASDTSLREEDEDLSSDEDDTSQYKHTGIIPNGKPGGPRADQNNEDMTRMMSWEEKQPSCMVENLQSHAPGSDQPDPGELDEVVSHDLESYLASIPEHCDVDGIGFTQSDSSLSSYTNPSYRYGNQVEYTGVQQYPNVEYCPEYYDNVCTLQEVTVEPPPKRIIKRMGDLPKVPFKTFESFDQCPGTVERQVSIDSLTYNESPPMRRQLSSVSSFQGTSLDEQQEKEKPEKEKAEKEKAEKEKDVVLGEEGDEGDSSPSVDSNRFTFPNERFSFRDDRLPKIQEDDSCEPGHFQKRSLRDRKFRNSGKTLLTRQKNTVQEDAESSLTGGGGGGESNSEEQSRGRQYLANGEMENESSDSDSADVASSTLLPNTQNKVRKKRHRNPSGGWSILEDPDFEGMEPTYV